VGRGGQLSATGGAVREAPAPIITFTPNPAVDVTSGVPRLADGVKLRCEPALREAGGGGINAARVAVELGCRALAVHTAGGATGEGLRAMMDEGGVESVVVPIRDETRESFTIHERESGLIYRFVLPGPSLAEPEWRACLDAVGERMSPGTVVLASGSLPPGAPDELIGLLADEARAHGARLLVDVSGAAMRAALAHGVHMARFNRPEFEEYVGRPLPDPPARMAEAVRLVDSGAAQVVVATLGEDGALVVGREVRVHLRAPSVDAVSPVGAGDSMMGGICVGLAAGWGLEDSCALGVAAAAAAHMTPGTGLCRRRDVQALFERMTGRPAPAPVGAR
jgi:6-phosphofructokinase 2